MILNPEKDACLLAQMEAALNKVYLETHLGKLKRDSTEGRLAIENALFRRYNQATEYAVPWVSRVAPLAGCQVVEIGCGSGSSTAAFARLAGHVHGYDIEPSYVEGARIRAQILELTNISCHAVIPSQLLSEIRRRHGQGQVDLVLLYAVLEHCTAAECLEIIQTGWNLLRPGGHLVIVETPNRFCYMDVHTTFLPFFHLLPTHIALRYYRRTQRQRVIDDLDKAIQISEQEAGLKRIRLGTGVSFHEFQIALGIEDLRPILAADGYEPEMLTWFPITLEERLLQTFFLARNVQAPIGFARFVLNLIFKKPNDVVLTEPLISFSSRAQFVINYADVKVDLPMRHSQLLQEFECLKNVALSIKESDADLLVPANQISISQGTDHIHLISMGNDPYLYLPPLNAPIPKAIMMINIDAPGPSILQVFYITSDHVEYAEECSIRVPIYCGYNRLIVELPSNITGRLRLDPGEIPGEYRLYLIELHQ